MKLHFSSCAAGLLLATPCIAGKGLLYTSNAQAIDSAPTTLTASEARLLIAQRLGLSQYHSLAGASSSIIDAINAYGLGGVQQFLGRQSQTPTGLILIEGVDGLDGVWPRSDIVINMLDILLTSLPIM